MLLLHERLEPLQHAACCHHLVVFVLAQFVARQNLEQHERVARGERIDRQGLAAQGDVALHLRHRHQAQEAVVAAHESEEIRPGLGNLTLPLTVGDQVVDRRHRDVELSVDEIGELEHRARRRSDFQLDAVAREEAFFLRHPDRPIEVARKHDQVDGLQRRGRWRWREQRVRQTRRAWSRRIARAGREQEAQRQDREYFQTDHEFSP